LRLLALSEGNVGYLTHDEHDSIVNCGSTNDAMKRMMTKTKTVNPPIRKTEQGRSHQAIAAALGSEILSGARKPGSRLPTAPEMFERFGVSRVVVREVIRTIAAKGMVTSKPRIGTIVSEPFNWSWLDPQVLEWRGNIGLDQAFLTQLTQIRLALEPAAASIAAENRTQQDIATMRTALKAMYEAGDDHQKFSKADCEFHNAIVAATHNPFFYSSISATGVTLFRFLSWIPAGSAANGKFHNHSSEMHGKILEAIALQDQVGAAHAMVCVINESVKDASSQLMDKN
jgi:DNA-binding FadR family transcriptional regulator